MAEPETMEIIRDMLFGPPEAAEESSDEPPVALTSMMRDTTLKILDGSDAPISVMDLPTKNELGFLLAQTYAHQMNRVMLDTLQHWCKRSEEDDKIGAQELYELRLLLVQAYIYQKDYETAEEICNLLIEQHEGMMSDKSPYIQKATICMMLAVEKMLAFDSKIKENQIYLSKEAFKKWKESYEKQTSNLTEEAFEAWKKFVEEGVPTNAPPTITPSNNSPSHNPTQLNPSLSKNRQL